MTVELMTTAVCWDSEENVSAKFAHHYSKGFFYFCPECFVRVVGAKSILDNFFFKAPQSHLQRCINAKASSTNANASGTSTPRPAYVPPPFIPSHLGMFKLKRKGTKPTDIQMQSLVSKVKVKPVVYPGTLAEVVEAWSLMTPSQRQQAPLSVAGQPLTYFNAFAQVNNTQRSIQSLGRHQLISYIEAKTSVLSNVTCFVTRRKFDTQNKPIRAIIKSTHPAAAHFANDQLVKLFLYGPAPSMNPKNTYFEMQPCTAYSGFVVMP